MQTISFIDCCSFQSNVPSVPDPNDKDGSNRAGEFPTKTALISPAPAPAWKTEAALQNR